MGIVVAPATQPLLVKEKSLLPMRFRFPINLIAFAAIAIAGCSHQSATNALIPSPAQGLDGVTHMTGTPAPIAMKHVMTWDKDDHTSNAILITPAQAAPWLNFALTVPATSKAVMAAGIKSALYMNPNRLAPGDLMYTSDETEFTHDCSGNRITEYKPNPKAYYTDPNSVTLQAQWVQAVITEKAWGGVFNYVFEDNADTPNPNNMSGTPCNFDWNAWTAATNALDTALGSTVIGNSLGYTLPGSTSPGPGIGITPSTSGDMSEDCYVGRSPSGYFNVPRWAATENTEIQMAQAGRLFICHADWFQDASVSVGQRLYFYASFLLTYDRDNQVVNTEFFTPSELHVMPEAQLVPTRPQIPTPADISGLLTPSGVYGRVYDACFLAGNYVGPCAIAVNANNPKTKPLAYPWPTKYQHTLVVSGEGVYDGGTVGTNGLAPPAMMNGATAVIAFP
jgi:hypothetical protein